MTYLFRQDTPREVSSNEGMVQFAGRTGLVVTFERDTFAIDSEMLATPMSMAVYFAASEAAKRPNATELHRFINDALAFAGFHVIFPGSEE